MSDDMQPLPEYEKPPVIEVVCGVQFDHLRGFSSVHFGEFWRRVKKDYPRTEDKPPLGEAFDDRPVPESKVEMVEFPIPRVFYIDSSGNYLLQVQPSRFLANWRKEKEQDQYPRFNEAQRRFLEGWNIFVGFLKDVDVGTPSVNQYELTYINHILEEEKSYPLGIQHYLPVFSWTSAQSIKFLPPPRSVGLRFKFRLPDSKGTLNVTVDHGQRLVDRKGILVVDLTARGPARKDWSDMDEWFSVAHEWIVRGFTDLTSQVAHREWRRRR
jgi:uncharacterized protein (TIGR04255 family)